MLKQLHQLQTKILQKLLFAESLSFSKMKPSKDIDNSLFVFHLQQLIREDFIEKKGREYKLTKKGKEFANRIGTDTQFKLQAKISVVIMPTRKKDSEVLVHTRLKQPFYGRQGYMSGKVNLGETVFDAAKRELKEESNLKGSPKLFLIRHDIVLDKKTRGFLEDKFFFCFIVRNPKGELSFLDEGKFEWVKRIDLKKHIAHPYYSIKRTLDFTEEAIAFKGKTPRFEERISYADKF